MTMMAYDPERVRRLRSAMAAAQEDLRQLSCADPEAAPATTKVRQASARLVDVWLPRLTALLDSAAMTSRPASGPRSDVLDEVIAATMVRAHGWAAEREAGGDAPTMTTTEVAALAEALQHGDLDALLADDAGVAWLAGRLTIIAADPVLQRAFAAGFDGWAPLADALARRRAERLSSHEDDGSGPAALPGAIDACIAGLATVYQAQQGDENLLDVLAAMDPYSAALFVRGITLSPVALARMTDAILVHYDAEPDDQPRWIDEQHGGPNTADILFANLLEHRDACLPYVLSTTDHPHTLWWTARDPTLAQRVVLTATDPATTSVADAGTIVRASIDYLRSADLVFEHTDQQSEASLVGQRAFLGTLIAPWLYQFGPRAAQWGWNAADGHAAFAWTITDSDALTELTQHLDGLHDQISGTPLVDPAGHLDVTALNEIGELWFLIGSAVQRREVANDAAQREGFDFLVTMISKDVTLLLGLIPVGGKVATKVAKKIETKALPMLIAWLEANGQVPPGAAHAAANSRERFGLRTAVVATVAVATVVAQLIALDQLPAATMAAIPTVADGGGGCDERDTFVRLSAFARTLPAGEARTGVDDVLKTFINVGSQQSLCA